MAFILDKQESKKEKSKISSTENICTIVLSFWSRKDELYDKKLHGDIDFKDVTTFIKDYYGNDVYWIIFTQGRFIGWELSSLSNIKPRIDFGPLNEINTKPKNERRIDSGLKQSKFPIGRFFYDSNSKSIYSMGQDDGKLMRGKVNTNNHSIEWCKIGTTKGAWHNYKKICIFNNTNIYFVESQMMETTLFGAKAVNNCRILNYNLKQNKFVKSIEYGAFTNGKIIQKCQQINNKSLFAQIHNFGCFLINPKEKDDKLRYTKIDIKNDNYKEYENKVEMRSNYWVPYNKHHENNVFFGYKKELYNFNLDKKIFTTIDKESNFEHINRSTPDMIGWNIVNTYWYQDNPKLLYVSSLSKRNPHAQFTLHRDNIHSNNNSDNNDKLDGSVVYYHYDKINQEIYDFRCNEWNIIDKNKCILELGPIKWKEYKAPVRKGGNKRGRKYRPGAGCTSDNCLLPFGRNFLYY